MYPTALSHHYKEYMYYILWHNTPFPVYNQGGGCYVNEILSLTTFQHTSNFFLQYDWCWQATGVKLLFSLWQRKHDLWLADLGTWPGDFAIITICSIVLHLSASTVSRPCSNIAEWLTDAQDASLFSDQLLSTQLYN